MKQAALAVLVVFGLALSVYAPAVTAQTQSISVTRGEINLGQTTNIVVSAPAAGTYTVVVVRPDSSRISQNFTFAAAGQTQSTNFGNTTLGFKTKVTLKGTYNVYLEQGGQLVSATSFYATNQLNVFMDFVNGGLCNYIAGAQRGYKIFPRFYVTYASNGAPLNKTNPNVVTFTLPDSSKSNASYHAATTEAPFPYGFYIGKFYPTWNYTTVGPWSPTAVITDGLGNTVTYQYVGPAFAVTPAQLSTSVQLTDTRTSQPASGFYNGQTVSIQATISYPTNAEPVPGFVGYLTSARGGSASALVGWGFYNSTTGTFGGGKSQGGLIAKVPMTYVAGSNGTFTGTLSVSNLPGIPSGSSYEVIVTSSDAASPPNQGFATVSVPPATFAPGTSTPPAVTETVTTTTQTTVTQAGTITQTATTAAASSGGVTFTLALAAAVGTLIVGLVAGIIARPGRGERRI